MESRQLMYHPVRQKEGWTATLAIYFLVLGIATYALAMFLVVPRSSDIDELGLFNPVYMKLHFGRITYPIYGHFHAMFVHPPVRYSEIAAFMRLGLTFPYAEGLMVAFLTIAIGLAIAWAGFDYLSKLGLLFGFSSAVIWMAQVYDRRFFYSRRLRPPRLRASSPVNEGFFALTKTTAERSSSFLECVNSTPGRPVINSICRTLTLFICPRPTRKTLPARFFRWRDQANSNPRSSRLP